jgi:hypothetical protein
MFRRTIIAIGAAAVLVSLGIGCSGPDPQPVLKNTNVAPMKQEPAKSKPSVDD